MPISAKRKVSYLGDKNVSVLTHCILRSVVKQDYSIIVQTFRNFPWRLVIPGSGVSAQVCLCG